MTAIFWDKKRVLTVEFMQQETTMTSQVYCETAKKLRRAIQNKRRGMLTSGVVLLHDNARPHARALLLALQHCWSISTGNSLTTLLTALILLQVTTTCLPTRRTGCDHSASTIMRSWWKVSKRGWAHRQQTSLTQAYKNLFPDTTSVSIPGVTTLRSSLSTYVYFVHNFFPLFVLLTAYQRLLSE
jgi:hypothetical protein